MKAIFVTLTAVFLLTSLTSASDVSMSEAKAFADIYEQELKAERQRKVEQRKILFDIRLAKAIYEEKEGTVSSRYKVFYPELSLALASKDEQNTEKAISLSFGHSLTRREKWFVDQDLRQTNDLYFSRAKIEASIAKELKFSFYGQDLLLEPYLGAGFIYINFSRTNFNVLNIITSREVVTEKYYLLYPDFGLRLDREIGEGWAIVGLASFGPVLYSRADNSALGSINGDSGYLVKGNFGLRNVLNESCELKFIWFAELQHIKGGSKGDIIWPDNKLDIYGIDIGMQFKF